MDYTTVNYSPVLTPAPPVSALDRALSVTDFSAGSRTNLPALSGGGPLVKRILTADYQERSRAALVSNAMENAAALSALEMHLNAVAPSGWRRYRALVDSYTVGAITMIAKEG